MLLGKRARQSMNRTTSMTEFALLDLSVDEAMTAVANTYQPFAPHSSFKAGDALSRPAASAGTHRRKSADFAETSYFLRACSLCKRGLIPDRDIYMYRGDNAFCSLECRQQQMIQDDRKEKSMTLMMTSTKEIATTSGVSAAAESEATTV